MSMFISLNLVFLTGLSGKAPLFFSDESFFFSNDNLGRYEKALVLVMKLWLMNFFFMNIFFFVEIVDLFYDVHN